MWLFTEDGFFSIVQHDQDEELLHVRARLREDLERFLRRAYRNAMEDLGQPDPEIEKAINSIRETPGADYRVRVDLPRFVVAGMILDAVLDMGYCSSKARIGSLREDSARAERSHAYLEVWSTMARFQDRVHGFRSPRGARSLSGPGHLPNLTNITSGL
jgi:hypothetical protein